MADVSDSRDLIGEDLSVKTGPSAPRVEFGLARIQGRVAHFTVIGSLAVLVI
jgi:hypothetical protein